MSHQLPLFSFFRCLGTSNSKVHVQLGASDADDLRILPTFSFTKRNTRTYSYLTSLCKWRCATRGCLAPAACVESCHIGCCTASFVAPAAVEIASGRTARLASPTLSQDAGRFRTPIQVSYALSADSLRVALDLC